ncbi:hypothetical protein Aple_093600 [Acrocarpospora pleiomorpha]|uniref:Uncharacterized protein n=1 Tax=Acrocarpospora pleiomorpha TaxID=90975 RepID=A0A5M3Y3P5_9ACTN|nr:hypothetical protein Aple_093600 [Acrocarpospora pleiomorpha]
MQDSGRARLPEGMEGMARLHALIGQQISGRAADRDGEPAEEAPMRWRKRWRWWSGSRPTEGRGWRR